MHVRPFQMDQAAWLIDFYGQRMCQIALICVQSVSVCDIILI